MSVGPNYSCGVRSDHTLARWGHEDGRTAAPAGSFKQVSAGGQIGCAIDADAQVVCWGDSAADWPAPPSGRFRRVSAGANSACAVTLAGETVCWGPFRGVYLF